MPAINSADIFELLDVARREDTYSCMIAEAIRRDPTLLDFVAAKAFRTDISLISPVVAFRQGVPGRGAGIMDIFVSARTPDGQTRVIFIENKIDAQESIGQTQRYLEAARQMVTSPAHAAGLLLSIEGQAPLCPDVGACSHRELAEKLRSNIVSFEAGSALHLALTTYIRRALVEMPIVNREERIGALFTPRYGLVPLHAASAAFGSAIATAANPGWTSSVVPFQGQGHGNPIVLFRRNGWAGPKLTNNAWTPENIDVHLEIDIIENAPGPLKLHFETSPYLANANLAQLIHNESFADAKDAFRAAVHNERQALHRWTMTNTRLQIAKFNPNFTALAPASDVIATYAEQMNAISTIVDQALNIAP